MSKQLALTVSTKAFYEGAGLAQLMKGISNHVKQLFGTGVSIKKIINIQMFAIRYFYHKLFTGFQHLGWGVTFGKNVSIRRAQYISLGDKVYLDNNVVLQLPGVHIRYGLQRPKLIIEDKVTVGLNSMISAAKLIHIKKNVLIAQNCFIGDHDHEYKDINVPIRYQGLKNVKPVIIEDGAWIGANVTICSGVTIGKNSVIGANSVVTKDIPNYSVAVGVPAKIIKKYDTKTKTWKKLKATSRNQDTY